MRSFFWTMITFVAVTIFAFFMIAAVRDYGVHRVKPYTLLLAPADQ